MEDLWKQFQQALKNYNETTEERKAAFETLKSKDEKSAKEIEMQMRKLQRISVSTLIREKIDFVVLIVFNWGFYISSISQLQIITFFFYPKV